MTRLALAALTALWAAHRMNGWAGGNAKRLSEQVPAVASNDHANHLAPPRRRNLSTARVEQILVNRVNQIALAQGFPVESISRIEQHFSGIGRPGRSLGGTKHNLHQWFPGDAIGCGNDDCGMISKARIERPDFPSLHRSSMLRRFLTALRIELSDVRPAICSWRSASGLGP